MRKTLQVTYFFTCFMMSSEGYCNVNVHFFTCCMMSSEGYFHDRKAQKKKGQGAPGNVFFL